jgi:hypothetical protein
MSATSMASAALESRSGTDIPNDDGDEGSENFEADI